MINRVALIIDYNINKRSMMCLLIPLSDQMGVSHILEVHRASVANELDGFQPLMPLTGNCRLMTGIAFGTPSMLKSVPCVNCKQQVNSCCLVPLNQPFAEHCSHHWQCQWQTASTSQNNGFLISMLHPSTVSGGLCFGHSTAEAVIYHQQ